MGDCSAFFYGTLMEPQVLYRVCYGSSTPTPFQRSLLTIRPAILHDYCRHKVRGYDYPAIIPSPEDCVRGTYVRGLTDGDIFRLDIFEGPEYERRKVKIRVLDVEGNEDGEGNVEGEEVEMETYVWVGGDTALEEGEWDFGEFRREKMHRWIGRREEYDEHVEKIQLEEEE
ncbi:MAG: hypothetical protein LQ341_003548 [Variospora aurantia]|nr:MAG: hypothetical protein LQ341_003548 [Variospora aurantia]